MNSQPSQQVTTSGETTSFANIKIDRNFARNPLSSFNEYGELRLLAMSLVYYFYYRLQNSYKDLLGVATFDPYEFQRVFNYSRQYLQTPVAHPYQRQIEGEREFKRLKKEHLVFDSRLEDVLYRMTMNKMPLQNSGKLRNGNNFTSIDGISILKRAVFLSDPLKPRRKVYGLVFHDEFFKNLNSYFSYVIEPSLFAELRRYNLYDLYLHIAALKDVFAGKNISRDVTNFDSLADIAGLESCSPAKLKMGLKRKFDKMVEISGMKVKLEFEKAPNGRFNYLPVISINPEYSEQIKRYADNDRINRFRHELFIQLRELFTTIYQEFVSKELVYERQFFGWLRNSQEDWERKAEYFNYAYLNIYKRTPPDVVRNNFLQDLKKIDFPSFIIRTEFS